jgi:polyphenol oxidase
MIQSRLLMGVQGLEHGFLGRVDKNASSQTISLSNNSIFPLQVHADTVVWVDGTSQDIEADGVLTRTKRIGVGVRTADCVPILLYEPTKCIIGAVHAGWKGTVKGIVRNAIHEIVKKGGSANKIISAFGPYIGLCCYEVGEEVAERFEGMGVDVVVEMNNVPHVNLAHANYIQLVDMGVSKNHIDMPLYCTSCQYDRFYSYRKKTYKNQNSSYIMIR